MNVFYKTVGWLAKSLLLAFSPPRGIPSWDGGKKLFEFRSFPLLFHVSGGGALPLSPPPIELVEVQADISRPAVPVRGQCPPPTPPPVSRWS
jgi:hypothetical protein